MVPVRIVFVDAPKNFPVATPEPDGDVGRGEDRKKSSKPGEEGDTARLPGEMGRTAGEEGATWGHQIS